MRFIEDIVAKYQAESLEVEKLLTTIYATMIAEENKDNARLKKRLKRLAVHQILVENWDTVTVADFSRDKHYDEVLRECQQRGL